MKLLITKDRILESIVRSLRTFGYPGATKENVTTDKIYRAFALSQLKEANDYQPHPELQALIDEIIAQDKAVVRDPKRRQK